ncbi:MAG: NADH-quinone oxidoreductase subunit J [Anaerolineaceae bacterium]|nr:NADH-quinone oxidoreductase subunit J [Anaerolineaceae bacterium]
MAAEYIFFFILAAVALVSAVGVLLSQNSIYTALFLVVNFSAIAVLFLTLGAPFIALAQITVYAGAIMILFLFVIMLLGTEKLPIGKEIPWQRPLGIILAGVLLLEGGYLILFRSGALGALNTPAADYASPNAIGLELFDNYLLPFEVTSILLLVALVGAIVLTKDERGATVRRLVTLETRAADDRGADTQKPDLLEYEKEIQAEEKREEVAGPGADEFHR